MIINLLAAWIPALLIALSGVMKLSRQPRIVDGMSKLGVGRYLVLLLRRRDRHRAVARRLEGQSLHPDRAALDRRFHSGSLDLFLICPLASGGSSEMPTPVVRARSVLVRNGLLSFTFADRNGVSYAGPLHESEM
jgi:hypothetical protein